MTFVKLTPQQKEANRLKREAVIKAEKDAEAAGLPLPEIKSKDEVTESKPKYTHFTFDTLCLGPKREDLRIIKINYNPDTLEAEVEGVVVLDNKITHLKLDLAKNGLDSIYIKNKRNSK